MKPTTISIATATLLSATVWCAAASTAQTTQPAPADRTAPTAPMGTPAAGGTAMPPKADAQPTQTQVDQKELESLLAGAQQRTDYVSLMEKDGYKVTSINNDKPDYAEYEVVKGEKSYEVALTFEEGAPKASKVEVSGNLWRDSNTKKVMEENAPKKP